MAFTLAALLFHAHIMIAASTEAEAPALPESSCWPGRLRCPIPSSWTHGNYVVNGSEANEAHCGMQGASTDEPYFEFDVSQCNTVIDAHDTYEEYTATLVDKPEEGTVVLEEFPPLLCVCRVILEGSAEQGVEQHTAGKTEHYSGTAAFEPSMVVCSDDTFEEPVAVEGGSVTVDADRFYMLVSSPTPGDNVNVSHCTSRPLSDVEGRYEVEVWDACDLDGPFEAQEHPSPGDEVRLSMRSFRFTSDDTVLLTCAVSRCATPPCLTCTDDRRLQSAGAEVASVASQLRIGPNIRPIALPGDLDEADFTPIYSGGGSGRLAAVRSVVFYNSPVSAHPAFVFSLENAISLWMDLRRFEVVVTKMATSGSGSPSRLRRLRNDGDVTTSLAEAMLITFEAAPVATSSSLEGAVAYAGAVLGGRSAESLATAWRNELSSTWGLQAPNLIVEKVAAEGQPYSMEAGAAPAPEASGGDVNDDDDDDDDRIFLAAVVPAEVALLAALWVCLTCVGLISARYCCTKVFAKQRGPYTAEENFSFTHVVPT